MNLESYKMIDCNYKDLICITAYKDPKMLSLLLDSIRDDFIVYVHIDKKNKELFEHVIEDNPTVSFYSEYAVNWGSYQHLEAILLLLRESMKEKWRYAHIISGEDYPIKSNQFIYERFSNDNRSYANYELSVDKQNHANRRYRYFWPYVKYQWNYKNKIYRFFSLFLIGVQYLFVRRRRIGNLTNIYWGFVWGDYHRDAIECILKYIGSNRRFISDLQWCKIPEEFLFQTILLNDPIQRNRIENKTLRFWQFDDGENTNPRYLVLDDIDLLINSDAIFARKFKSDSNVLFEISKLRIGINSNE